MIFFHLGQGTPDPDNANKMALYEEIQQDFQRDLSRFQHELFDASREFQTCTEREYTMFTFVILYDVILHFVIRYIYKNINFYQL